MRVLALDVGDRRIGVALSDALGITAQPLEVWKRQAPDADMEHMAHLVTQHHVTTVFVGHPITMAGTASPQTVKAETFAGTLRARVTCPVTLWDERLTTAQGERALLEGGMRRAKRRVIVNVVAAQLLLQHYLDSQPKASAT